MTNIEEQLIYYFETGENHPQDFFDTLIESALNYKYRNLNGLAIPISDKDITKAIFNLSVKDSLYLYNEKVNGQRIIELFIVSIYLKYLDNIHKNKLIIVALPFDEKSYDVAVYVTGKGSCQYIKDGNKCKLSKKSISYYIQVKEEFDYSAYTKGYKDLKKGLDVESIEKKSKKYNDLVLIFMRDYLAYNTDEGKSFFRKNKNVGLISMPSLEQKEIIVKDEVNGNEKIVLEENKYNFFLYSNDCMVHIKFNRPKFLIPRMGDVVNSFPFGHN